MSEDKKMPKAPSTPARKPQEAIDSEKKARDESRREERRPTDSPEQENGEAARDAGRAKR